LCNTDENAAREWAVLQMLEEHRVDGVILVSSRLSEERLAEAVGHWRPMVLVNRGLPAGDTGGHGSVTADDATAAAGAINHLLARGHRRVGLLGGTPTSRSALERRRGFADTLHAAGLSSDAVVDCPPTVEGGRQATLDIIGKWSDLTALQCYNDLVAVGALQACRALGRRVPEDCALVGWDDIVFAGYLSPALTTVRMPKTQMGCTAMELLLRLLRYGDTGPLDVRLEATLIVREST
jgi:LacI family transcriptional regulator